MFMESEVFIIASLLLWMPLCNIFKRREKNVMFDTYLIEKKDTLRTNTKMENKAGQDEADDGLHFFGK